MESLVDFGQNEGINHYSIQLLENLWQGSRGPGQSDEFLSQRKITNCLAISNVTLTPVKSAYRWVIPVDDNLGWSRDQVFLVETFFLFLKRTKSSGFVHCDHGASRSSGGLIICRMIEVGCDKNEARAWLQANNPRSRVHEAIFSSIPEIYLFY